MTDADTAKTKAKDPQSELLARVARIEKLGGLGQFGSTIILVILMFLKPGVTEEQMRSAVENALRREMEPVKERLQRLELRDELRDRQPK